MTKEEKIKQLELELKRLKTSEEDKRLANKIATLREKYLGKTVSINNIEEGSFYIYKVEDIDDDGYHAVFHGRGVFDAIQENSFIYTDDDIEAVSFYDDIKVYEDVETLKKDIIKAFQWTLENNV